LSNRLALLRWQSAHSLKNGGKLATLPTQIAGAPFLQRIDRCGAFQLGGSTLAKRVERLILLGLLPGHRGTLLAPHQGKAQQKWRLRSGRRRHTAPWYHPR